MTGIIFARMAKTAPVISSTLSPRTLRAMRKPPICDGVTSPDSMASKAAIASLWVSAAPAATLAIKGLKYSMRADRSAPKAARVERGGQVQEIAQDLSSVLARDAFGMELHPVNRTVAMLHRHDEAVV